MSSLRLFRPSLRHTMAAALLGAGLLAMPAHAQSIGGGLNNAQIGFGGNSLGGAVAGSNNTFTQTQDVLGGANLDIGLGEFDFLGGLLGGDGCGADGVASMLTDLADISSAVQSAASLVGGPVPVSDEKNQSLNAKQLCMLQQIAQATAAVAQTQQAILMALGGGESGNLPLAEYATTAATKIASFTGMAQVMDPDGQDAPQSGRSRTRFQALSGRSTTPAAYRDDYKQGLSDLLGGGGLGGLLGGLGENLPFGIGGALKPFLGDFLGGIDTQIADFTGQALFPGGIQTGQAWLDEALGPIAGLTPLELVRYLESGNITNLFQQVATGIFNNGKEQILGQIGSQCPMVGAFAPGGQQVCETLVDSQLQKLDLGSVVEGLLGNAQAGWASFPNPGEIPANAEGNNSGLVEAYRNGGIPEALAFTDAALSFCKQGEPCEAAAVAGLRTMNNVTASHKAAATSQVSAAALAPILQELILGHPECGNDGQPACNSLVNMARLSTNLRNDIQLLTAVEFTGLMVNMANLNQLAAMGESGARAQQAAMPMQVNLATPATVD